jgi:hypothetical protein
MHTSALIEMLKPCALDASMISVFPLRLPELQNSRANKSDSVAGRFISDCAEDCSDWVCFGRVALSGSLLALRLTAHGIPMNANANTEP